MKLDSLASSNSWVNFAETAVFLLSVSMYISCATSSIVSVKDELLNEPRFARILVSAPYYDLEQKDMVESIITEGLYNPETDVFRAIDILPPLREYSISEIADTLLANRIQAVLVVAITDFWTTYYSTPGRSVTTVDLRSDERGVGGLFSVHTTGTATTEVQPGITLEQSNARLDARLFVLSDSDSLRLVWRANSTTVGSILYPDGKVLKSAARKIADQTIADGFVAESKRFMGFDDALIVWGGKNHDVKLGYLKNRTTGQLTGPMLDESMSIKNKKGRFGAESIVTIWDRSSVYSSDTSECSVCNPDASNPPIISNKYRQAIGKLTVNDRLIASKLDMELSEWLKKKVCK